MANVLKRFYHLSKRIIQECKAYPERKRSFGTKVAKAAFRDGIIPPGKSPEYIRTVSEFVDGELETVVEKYNTEQSVEDNLSGSSNNTQTKIPIWCCWWQGEESMPDLVKLCHTRLKQVIPPDKAELHLISFDNYKDYVEFPDHILKKYHNGQITMTTMSDVLRFLLLEKYGGYWLDATVFFTGIIPEEYFTDSFYCQRMVSRTALARREACGCNWCGFSMAGQAHSIVFRYMNDAFSKWWNDFDSIIDYVLIDYLLLTGYRHIPQITEIINHVPDNNEDIFEMYKVLNYPYSRELLEQLTVRNVMHKLTYKEITSKTTKDGKMTLYGFLWKSVFEHQGRFDWV
ncbi:MAG: hypothetical protein IKE94_03795 [Aeriscardovia sp.]|nr:hypothetical protein [Aeriscardovia sp.]